MKIHHHHPETGAYLGTTDAQPDPMEPGRWLIPAHATTDEPPEAPQGRAVRRMGEAWELFDVPQPPAPPAPPSAAQLRAWAINARLQAIDAASARPARELIRAQALGKTAPAFAVSKLGALEDEAASLRAELQGMKL
ncbi:hypothetical protein [Aquabacterium sp.]|uniref:hypothetical protein n=1 Tax=Aquabacterium sp. TaxID=1872578 RepID=UPI0025C178BE|nr:hypothetical protein [Aquabacterium sp.]